MGQNGAGARGGEKPGRAGGGGSFVIFFEKIATRGGDAGSGLGGEGRAKGRRSSCGRVGAACWLGEDPQLVWGSGRSAVRRRLCCPKGRPPCHDPAHWPVLAILLRHESNEPPHVHIDRDNATAKFWPRPVRLASAVGFSWSELRRLERLVQTHQQLLSSAGMTTSKSDEKDSIVRVRFATDRLSAELADGRVISVPLAWFPRLLNASAAERNNWQLSAAGFGVHWPDLDEDLSAEGLLRGARAPGGKSSGVG